MKMAVEKRKGARLFFFEKGMGTCCYFEKERRVIMSDTVKDWMTLISPEIKYGNNMCEKKV